MQIVLKSVEIFSFLHFMKRLLFPFRRAAKSFRKMRPANCFSPKLTTSTRGGQWRSANAKVWAYDIELLILELFSRYTRIPPAGLVREIGVCNFNRSQLERLLAHANIKPFVLQVCFSHILRINPFRPKSRIDSNIT